MLFFLSRAFACYFGVFIWQTGLPWEEISLHDAQYTYRVTLGGKFCAYKALSTSVVGIFNFSDLIVDSNNRGWQSA